MIFCHECIVGISIPLLCVWCRLPGSGAAVSGGTVARPIAPDLVANATNAAVTAAASAIDLSSMEIDVVAVGMGLRFVEIESGNQEVCYSCLYPRHTVHCAKAAAATCICCSKHVLAASKNHLLEPAFTFKCMRYMLGVCPVRALLDMGHITN